MIHNTLEIFGDTLCFSGQIVGSLCKSLIFLFSFYLMYMVCVSVLSACMSVPGPIRSPRLEELDIEIVVSCHVGPEMELRPSRKTASTLKC